MLNKKDMIPGTKVEVVSLNGKTAGIILGGAIALAAVRIWQTPGMSLAASAGQGDVLTVTKGPRNVRGINLCRVETAGGITGEVYWTELRGNCILSG